MNKVELAEFNKIKGFSSEIISGFKLLKEINQLNDDIFWASDRSNRAVKKSFLASKEKAFNKLSKQDQQSALDLWRS